jgi:hypothetical protein
VSKVSVFLNKDEKWVLDNWGRTSIFDVETSSITQGSNASLRPYCVAAVQKIQSQINSKDKLRNKFLSTVPIRNLNVVELNFDETKHLLLFQYRTASRNCAKNLGNPYLPTTFENRHLSPSEQLTGFRVKQIQSSPSEIIVVVEDGYQPFPSGFKLVRSGTSLGVQIHGRTIRGYTGLISNRFTLTRLTLINSKSKSNTDIYLPDDLGTKNAYAPWNTSKEDIPDGNYIIKFYGKTHDNKIWDIELAKVTIQGDQLKLEPVFRVKTNN